jgi:hypothetical protein
LKTPVDAERLPNLTAYLEALGEPAAIGVDGRAGGEALRELDCEAHLRWTNRQVTLGNGKVQSRYELARWRFHPGQQEGRISQKNCPKSSNASYPGLTMAATGPLDGLTVTVG